MCDYCYEHDSEEVLNDPDELRRRAKELERLNFQKDAEDMKRLAEEAERKQKQGG